MSGSCVAADRAVTASGSSVASNAVTLTNLLSNWTIPWTNLTVRSDSVPWGRSYSKVFYGTNRVDVSANRREFLEAFAKARREAEPVRRVQERLKERSFAETYRVSLDGGDATK